jgi:threonine dehydrogenase-like Zn-dependent dehydrogenase
LGADELALVEPFSIGAHAVKRAKLKEGQKVMVIGAGPIGLATMEMARMAGAEAAVCDVNNGRLDFCRKILDGNRVMNAGSSDLADRLKEWTGGDMPEVVFDASGNLNAIEAGFQYISYAGTYVLVGLQRGFIRFSHPEFHKRETTLMSSRNANRQDFEQVVDCMVKGFLVPGKYITHRLTFEHAGRDFGGLLDPKAGAIKALISFEI